MQVIDSNWKSYKSVLSRSCADVFTRRGLLIYSMVKMCFAVQCTDRDTNELNIDMK